MDGKNLRLANRSCCLWRVVNVGRFPWLVLNRSRRLANLYACMVLVIGCPQIGSSVAWGLSTEGPHANVRLLTGPASSTALDLPCAPDSSYGYSEKDPIKVGGIAAGPGRQRQYFQLLRGPHGEAVTAERVGSCCPIKSKEGVWIGLLDLYRVTIAGAGKPVELYVSMYESGPLYAPAGFACRRPES